VAKENSPGCEGSKSPHANPTNLEPFHCRTHNVTAERLADEKGMQIGISQAVYLKGVYRMTYGTYTVTRQNDCKAILFLCAHGILYSIYTQAYIYVHTVRTCLHAKRLGVQRPRGSTCQNPEGPSKTASGYDFQHKPHHKTFRICPVGSFAENNTLLITLNCQRIPVSE
jgi:hypothetical protein